MTGCGSDIDAVRHHADETKNDRYVSPHLPATSGPPMRSICSRSSSRLATSWCFAKSVRLFTSVGWAVNTSSACDREKYNNDNNNRADRVWGCGSS